MIAEHAVVAAPSAREAHRPITLLRKHLQFPTAANPLAARGVRCSQDDTHPQPLKEETGMRQLFVHAPDPATGRFAPVYRVYALVDGTAVVSALQPGWEQVAQGVQRRLNRQAQEPPLRPAVRVASRPSGGA